MSNDLVEPNGSFTPNDPGFLADPYPALNALREAAPGFWNEQTGQWTITRFSDVHEALRDRRLGRPPDHTRIRRLVAKVFTPRAVTAMRPEIERWSDELLDACRERGRFELLDWSHKIVKMYELAPSEEVMVAANQAAAEYIDFTKALIAAKRRAPDSRLVSELVSVEDEGDVLTEAEIISTTMVLLEAGHEATVNTLGNGLRTLMLHRGEWERLVRGEVPAKAAVEELLRWDAPLHLFERWVLEPGVVIAGEELDVGPERSGPHRVRWRHPLLRRSASRSSGDRSVTRRPRTTPPSPGVGGRTDLPPQLRDPRPDRARTQRHVTCSPLTARHFRHEPSARHHLVRRNLDRLESHRFG